MFNVPDAPVLAEIELNTQGEKANRFIDNFYRMATIPHKFDHGEERRILVFTKENVNLNPISIVQKMLLNFSGFGHKS